MKTVHLIEGLTILEKYRDGEDGFNTDAEHDVIYACSTDRPVEDEDLARLIEIGWYQPDADYDDDDFAAEYYDPNLSWGAFI